VDSLIRWAGVFLFAAAGPALQAADAPSADELLKLEGPALFKAADDISFSNDYAVDELVAIAAKLGDELKNLPREDHDNDRYAFSHFFEDGCRKANERQLDQLIQVYIRLDATSFEKESVLPALAAQWIHRELRALRGDKSKIKLPDHDVSLPGELENASKELVSAWRLYRKSMEAYEKTFPDEPVENPISFQANNRSFFSIIEDVLLGKGKGAAEKILNYGWSGPRSLAVFMSLLHERRLAEAVGASLLVAGDQLLVGGEDKLDVRIEFLEACGLDWETILAGAQTDAECRQSYHNADLFAREPLLTALAGYGSGRTALLLAEMARRAKPDRQEAYANALTALVEKNPAKPKDCPGYENIMNTFSSGTIERVSKIRIPSAVQKELIGIVQAFVTATTNREVAAPALTMFARARSRETIPVLRSLLKHPSAEVSRDAASILCAMGEKVEADAMTKADPVSFKILVNGQPLPAGFEVAWNVHSSSGVSSTTVVDQDGAFTISREHFLDSSGSPRGVSLHSSVSQSPDQPWFDVDVPAPSDLDAVPAVEVEVFTVNLLLENLSKLNQPPGATALVQIRKEPIGEESVGSYPEFEWRKIDVPIGEPIALPPLQSGTYSLKVEVSGAAQSSQKVELTPNAPQVIAQLEPGSDVRINVTGAGIENFSSFNLLKNGAEFESPFDNKSRTYTGLPEGNYVLHIPSSEELRKSDGILDNYQPGPDEVPYAGRDIAFTIGEGSPSTIDLGEIHLETLPK
jgi:hypothetical protein